MDRVVNIVIWAVGLALLAASPASGQEACCRTEGLEVAERYRVEGLDQRRFTHEAYWQVLAPALRSDRLRVTRLGESIEGRAIQAVTAGSGPTTVLLWSQMHGNESAATMSLADLIHWLATAPESDSLRAQLAARLTIVMIPMLNPDGAERFIRENAVGVDINRDARRTATPEGRILKSVRDSIQADFGFNLHDQGTHTAGDDGPLVAIALLAPAADEERILGPGPSAGPRRRCGDRGRSGARSRRPDGALRRCLLAPGFRRQHAGLGHEHRAHRERHPRGRPAEAGAAPPQRRGSPQRVRGHRVRVV